MEILVLVKPVPEAESRLRPGADGRRLDPEGLKFVLAGYDESAVEQALLLKESIPGSHVRAVSFGPTARAEEVLRACLALGGDTATVLEAPAEPEVDTADLARLFAGVLPRYPSDLILLGKQAGDDEAGLVPTALGARLGRPAFNHVVELRFDAGTKTFRFQRAREIGLESWEVPAPLVVGLQQAWNDPRTAKLQNILKSRKMPLDRVPASELAQFLQTATRARASRFELPPPRTGAKMIEYSSAEDAAAKLVQILRSDAKVLP